MQTIGNKFSYQKTKKVIRMNLKQKFKDKIQQYNDNHYYSLKQNITDFFVMSVLVSLLISVIVWAFYFAPKPAPPERELIQTGYIQSFSSKSGNFYIEINNKQFEINYTDYLKFQVNDYVNVYRVEFPSFIREWSPIHEVELIESPSNSFSIDFSREITVEYLDNENLIQWLIILLLSVSQILDALDSRRRSC